VKPLPSYVGLSCLPTRSSPWRTLPRSVPRYVLVGPCSPWPRPLPPPTSAAGGPAFVRRLHRRIAESDFSRPFNRAAYGHRLPDAGPARDCDWSDERSPGVPVRGASWHAGSPTHARSVKALGRWPASSFCPGHLNSVRHPGIINLIVAQWLATHSTLSTAS